MKALVWHGKEDIRCDTVSDPRIEQPGDAIIKVTSCAICGSDLHLFNFLIPAMLPGDIMGHESMGVVVEVGPDVRTLKKGDRVVIPFTIQCGECEQCVRGNFSVCERTNRKKQLGDKMFGHATAGLFGYTHLTGGYPGGQAEYLRVPFADTTHVKVPDGIPDEKLLFLSDILPTGWQAAVQCDIQPDDTVAIWGCGPVGQMAIRSALLLGAKQVIGIDHLPERLMMAGAYNRALRILYRVPVHDVDSAFKLIRGDVAREAPIRARTGFAVTELVLRAAARGRTVELGVTHLPRRTGEALADKGIANPFGLELPSAQLVVETLGEMVRMRRELVAR